LLLFISFLRTYVYQDGHEPPSMNASPFGGRRRREDMHSRGGFNPFYDQHHQQDMPVPERDLVLPSYETPILSDRIHYDYHHGEFPLPECAPGDLPNDNAPPDDFYGREPVHRGFHGRRGVFPPCRFPSPHGDDR